MNPHGWDIKRAACAFSLCCLWHVALLGGCGEEHSAALPEEESDVITHLTKQSSDELVVLTVNLHTYQETDAQRKLALVADTIARLDADLVAFQECAQHKDSPLVDAAIRSDNMAHLIARRLREEHQRSDEFAWDWAHYGWNVWEEGVAVLSKYPIVGRESRWISSATGRSDLTSRKAVLAQVELPQLQRRIHLVSTHLHWRTSPGDLEQNQQVAAVKQLAADSAQQADVTFICGDFNATPTSASPYDEAYQLMGAAPSYVDTYYDAHTDANRVPADAAHHTIFGSTPGRIDYIWMQTNDAFSVQASEILFTPADLGRVSDHYGVATRLRRVR